MIGAAAAFQVDDAGKLTGRNMNDLECRLASALIQPLPGRGAAAEEQRGEHGTKGNPDVHETRLRPASRRKSTTGGTVRPAARGASALMTVAVEREWRITTCRGL